MQGFMASPLGTPLAESSPFLLVRDDKRMKICPNHPHGSRLSYNDVLQVRQGRAHGGEEWSKGEHFTLGSIPSNIWKYGWISMQMAYWSPICWIFSESTPRQIQSIHWYVCLSVAMRPHMLLWNRRQWRILVDEVIPLIAKKNKKYIKVHFAM